MVATHCLKSLEIPQSVAELLFLSAGTGLRTSTVQAFGLEKSVAGTDLGLSCLIGGLDAPAGLADGEDSGVCVQGR